MRDLYIWTGNPWLDAIWHLVLPSTPVEERLKGRRKMLLLLSRYGRVSMEYSSTLDIDELDELMGELAQVIDEENASQNLNETGGEG